MKKFLLSFLLVTVFFSSFIPNFLIAKAQEDDEKGFPVTPAEEGTWYNQNFFTWHEKVYDPENQSEIFGERYTAAQVQWVIYGLISMIFNLTGNQDVVNCVIKNKDNLAGCAEALKNVFPKTEKTAEINQDKSLLALMFDKNRPLSGISYVKQKIDKFDIVPEVQAQQVGFGFNALKPVQDMWRGARDISFGLFVIMAVVLAFMIMFRVKINPQTIITVQSAIPRIVGALIFVTFSYAIAGFLIDVMYVVIGILSAIISSFFAPQILEGITSVAVFNFMTYGQPLGYIQIGAIAFLFVVTFPLWLMIAITLILGAIGAGLFSAGILFWLPLGILIIVSLVMLWMGIKTIWALFKAFANIILLTIFAPLQIVIGIVLPSLGVGQWIRSYISHLSVFVVTGVLGILSLFFTIEGMGTVLIGIAGGSELMSALIASLSPVIPLGNPLSAVNAALQLSSPWPPLLGTDGETSIGLMYLGVAFVLFTMIPKATELIQGILAGKPFAYGSAIGEAMGPVNAVWGATAGNAYQGIMRGRQEAAWQEHAPTINKILRNLTPPSLRRSSKLPDEEKPFIS